MNITQALLAVVGIAGGGAGISTLLKFKPERESIIVTSAQGVATMQKDLIDELQEELAKCHDRMNEVNAKLDAQAADLREQIEEAKARFDELMRQHAAAKAENQRLTEAVERLNSRINLMIERGFPSADPDHETFST